MNLTTLFSTLLMAITFLAIEAIATPTVSSSLAPLTGPFDGLPFPMDTQSQVPNTGGPVHEYSIEEMVAWYKVTMAEHVNTTVIKRGKVSINHPGLLRDQGTFAYPQFRRAESSVSLRLFLLIGTGDGYISQVSRLSFVTLWMKDLRDGM